MYGDASSAFGTCIEISTVDADTIIMAKAGDGYGKSLRLFVKMIMILAYQGDIDKVCRTYWAKPLNGTCGKAVTSSRAGLSCLSDLDCPTSDTNTYAKCKCGYSTKGQKYCDIEGGDDLWLNAATAFTAY